MQQERPKETCTTNLSPQREYERVAKDEYSYIHEHLTTLYFIVSEFKTKRILEIGTGNGHSTLAMAEAAKPIGGHVTTIDIEECKSAKDLIFSKDLGEIVTFIKSDSLKIGYESSLDLVFIDGAHTYAQVMAELKKYAWLVNIGGFIILHDIANPAHPDVWEAINDWFLNAETCTQFQWYRYFNCNGLLILRRHDPNEIL